MSDVPKVEDTPITISLVPRHWVVVLGALERLSQTTQAKVQELKKQGVDHATLDPAVVTALAGPTIIRGIILKELTQHGVMTPEANALLGIDRIMEQIRKYRENE